jgi:hypothetical protein
MQLIQRLRSSFQSLLVEGQGHYEGYSLLEEFLMWVYLL